LFSKYNWSIIRLDKLKLTDLIFRKKGGGFISTKLSN